MVCFPAVPGSRPRRGAELTPAQSEITDKASPDRTAVRAGFSEDFWRVLRARALFFYIETEFYKDLTEVVFRILHSFFILGTVAQIKRTKTE